MKLENIDRANEIAKEVTGLSRLVDNIQAIKSSVVIQDNHGYRYFNSTNEDNDPKIIALCEKFKSDIAEAYTEINQRLITELSSL